MVNKEKLEEEGVYSFYTEPIKVECYHHCKNISCLLV